MSFARILIFLSLLGALAMPAGAFEPEKDITVVFRKGAVVLTAPPGAHLKKSFTEVTLTSKPGSLKVGPLPAGDARDELNEEIYHGAVRIPVTGEGLAGDVTLEVQYQPCTEGAGGNCYAPTVRTLKVAASDIPGTKGGVGAPQPAAEGHAAQAPVATAAPSTAPAPAAVAVPPAAAPSQAAPPPPAPRQGFLLALLVVFLAGMGASLTPCVYPMISITMAIIGAKGGGKLKGFSLSLLLVLGMAVTYTLLGVMAALSGATFGAFAQRPAFLIPVSALFALFALSLFGAFELSLPQGLQNRLQGDGPRKGYTGAFLVGLVLGPLAAPCVGPIIGAVLLGIAQQGDALRGGIQLFTFALGMGVLFIAVGTFSAGLPRSGEWLTRFKRIMGLVVLAFAVWNLRLVVPEAVSLLLWTATALTGSAVLGAFEPGETFLAQLRKGLGLLLLVLAALLGLRALDAGLGIRLLPAGGPVAAEKAPGPWISQDFEGALARAQAEHKVVLLDTYAEWCAQCKELDGKTWPDPQVSAWIQDHAIAVRVDTFKVRPDLATRLHIASYPTVLLLDAQGHEIRRSMGFLEPSEMLAWLKK